MQTALLIVAYALTSPFDAGHPTRATTTTADGGAQTPQHAGVATAPLADGFDYPVGDADGKGAYTSLVDGKRYPAWYRATKAGDRYALGIHTGEDWNGSGGGDTDLGQPVYAAAIGVVVFAGPCPPPWGNVVLLRHRFLEDGVLRTVDTQYAHLRTVDVKPGNVVARRQLLGTIGKGHADQYVAHLHFEVRNERALDLAVDYWPSSHFKDLAWVRERYEDPSTFIAARRKLSTEQRRDPTGLTKEGGAR